MKQECLGSFTLGVDILLFYIFKFKEKAPSFQLIWLLPPKWNIFRNLNSGPVGFSAAICSSELLNTQEVCKPSCVCFDSLTLQ